MDDRPAAGRSCLSVVEKLLTPYALVILVSIVAYTILFVGVGLFLGIRGDNPDFFDHLKAPGSAAAWMACFFSVSSVLSLVMHGFMSPNKDVRAVGQAGTLLALYYTLVLAFYGQGIVYIQVTFTAIIELGVMELFLLTLAVCARGGIFWSMSNLILYAVLAVILSATNPLYQAGSGARNTLILTDDWTRAVFYVYYILGAIIRAGSIHSCEREHSISQGDRWWFRFVIVVHVGLYLSAWAAPHVKQEYGANAMSLFTQIVIVILYTMTPLALLHFMTLKTLMSREAAATLALVQTTRLESEAKAAARQDFLRYIVHEIRVPFNSIALGLDNLTATPTVSSDPQLISDVSFMQTAADGMTQILNDTLDVEKLDSGKFSLELCESDIQTVVARAVHSMSLGARDARVIINTSLDPALPSKVLTDPNRLRQVLSNFISNAIKFSPHDGGGIVTIAARPIARPEQLPAGFVAGQGGAGRGQAGAAADGGDDAATRRAPWYATWCCMRCYNASPHAWQSVGAAFTVLDRWIVNASNRVADWYCDVCESLWDFIVRLACLVFCCTRKMRRQLAAVQPAPQLPTDSPSAATAFGTPSAQLVPVDVEHGQQAPPSPQLHLLTADQAQTHFDPTPHVEGPRATPNTATSTTLTDTARTVTNATADLPTVRTVAPPSLAVAPQQQQQQRQQQSDLHYDDRGDEDGPVCYRRVSNAARCRVNLVQYHDVNEIGRRPSPPPRSSGTRFSTAVAAVGATPSPSPMSGALAPPRSPASSLAGLGLRRRGAGTIRSLPHSEPSGSSTPRPRGRNNSLVQAVDPSATSYMYSGDALEIQWVRLEVTDNGIGVSATDQSKLFKAFGQIQAGKLQEGKGTGLGLYICSQLTLRLGGRIGSVSSEGKGSTFFVELPLPVIEGPASSLGGFGASDSVAVRIPGGASSGAHAAPPTASTIPTLVLPSPATTAPSSSSSSSLPAPPPTVPSLPSEQPVPVLPRIVEEESAASSAGSADSATLAAGSPPATSNAADAVAAAASDAGSLAGQSLSPRAAPPAAIAVATVRSLSGSLLGIELPPIVRGARPAVTALPSPVGAPAGTRTLYPRRILIVDDDRLSRAFLGRALSRHFPGAIISEAADGFEAVDLIRVHLQSRRNEESSSEVGPAEALALPSAAGHGGGDGIQIDHPPTPDRTAIAAPTPSSPPSIRLTPIEVICMDNNMPRLGGLEAATRIRQAGFSQAIIGVTGEAGPEAAEDFVRAGANAVVAKPVATDSLVAAIRRVGEALGHRTA